MPQRGFIINGETYTLDEALAASKDGLIQYPPALIKASFNTRVSQSPSPSSVAGCLRQLELQRTVDYYRTIESYLPALFGIGVHDLLERQEQGGHTEYSMQATLLFPDLPAPYNKIVMSGRSDHIDTERGVISDYKTKVFIHPKTFKPSAKHVIQLNCYNWLWTQMGNRPLEFYTLYYASQTAYRVATGPLSDPEKVGAWVHERVRLWASAVAYGKLPPPLASVFEKSTKNQGACAYCDVRAACLSSLREEEAEFALEPLAEDEEVD